MLKNKLEHTPYSVINFIRENGTQVSFKKNEYIYQATDQREYIYLILNGQVVISRSFENGKEFAMKLLSTFGLFGSTEIYPLQPTYQNDAQARSDVVLVKMDTEVFERSVLEDQVLTYEWIQWLQIDNIRKESRIRDLFQCGKKGSLYSTLIRLSNSYGRTIDGGILLDISLTNQELANFTGSSREVMNRMLNELVKLNILSIDRKKITLHNIDYLRQEISCEECIITICRIE